MSRLDTPEAHSELRENRPFDGCDTCVTAPDGSVTTVTTDLTCDFVAAAGGTRSDQVSTVCTTALQPPGVANFHEICPVLSSHTRRHERRSRKGLHATPRRVPWMPRALGAALHPSHQRRHACGVVVPRVSCRHPNRRSISMSSKQASPHPLSAYVMGTLRLVFTDGGEHSFPTSQRSAVRLLAIQRGAEPDEPALWHDPGWVMWHSTRVGAVDWTADPWGGQPVTKEAKKRQRDRGHERGWLHSLLDHWAGREEPEFTRSQMGMLCALAEVLGPAELGRFSEKIEGSADEAALSDALEWIAAAKPDDDTDEPDDTESDEERIEGPPDEDDEPAEDPNE